MARMLDLWFQITVWDRALATLLILAVVGVIVTHAIRSYYDPGGD